MEIFSFSIPLCLFRRRVQFRVYQSCTHLFHSFLFVASLFISPKVFPLLVPISFILSMRVLLGLHLFLFLSSLASTAPLTSLFCFILIRWSIWMLRALDWLLNLPVSQFWTFYTHTLKSMQYEYRTDKLNNSIAFRQIYFVMSFMKLPNCAQKALNFKMNTDLSILISRH